MHCCPADFHSPPKEERRRGSLNLAFNKSLYCSWPRPAAPAPLNAAPANPAKKSLTAFAATATAPCCICPTSSSDCFISPFAVFIGIRNTAAELELPELEAAELGLLELGATELKLLELEAAKLELPELEASELELPTPPFLLGRRVKVCGAAVHAAAACACSSYSHQRTQCPCLPVACASGAPRCLGCLAD